MNANWLTANTVDADVLTIAHELTAGGEAGLARLDPERRERLIQDAVVEQYRRRQRNTGVPPSATKP